ncbi:unnamed protein product [Macrosiphum euphorbiae]|uniref:THAP-type domain-containing protein n=1 Tax=Macrosiphum euphorbiae TaxID=13131 RepID=A0AAV0WFP0_9HEMI|nr:unnamed protein product [Macrosiphum euphorbiae]
MAQTCCVLGCANRSGRDKVVFFKYVSVVLTWTSKHSILQLNNYFTKSFMYRFPRNNILKEKWIVAIKRHNFIPTYHRICHIHFTENDFVERPDLKRLKETAVPTLFIAQEKIKVDVVKQEHAYCQFTKPNVESDKNRND